MSKKSKQNRKDDFDDNPSLGEDHSSSASVTGSSDSSSSGLQKKGYSFQFDSTGKLISATETERGVTKVEKVGANESFALQTDGTVVKTELKKNGVEKTVFADADGDGLFNRVSETFQFNSPSTSSSSTSGTGTTTTGSVSASGNASGVSANGTLTFQGSSGHDKLAVRGGDDARGGQGADDFVIREAAHLKIVDFDDKSGDHLVFDTGFGLTKLDLERYVTALDVSGNDLIVRFGADVSITLVGVANSNTLGWDDVTVIS